MAESAITPFMKSVKDMAYSQEISAKAVQAHDRYHFQHEDGLTLPTFRNHINMAKVIRQFKNMLAPFSLEQKTALRKCIYVM